MPLALKQSTLTALAACLFAAGFVIAFVALYHETARGRWMAIAALLLIGTLACWIASAQAGERES